MAAPPPHGGNINPDRRPLPDGWITRYDDNYRAWYYVDTRTQPPRSSWAHPLGSAPQGSYGSTADPLPSPTRNYGPGGPPYSQQPQTYNTPQYQSPPFTGAQGNPETARGFPQQGFSSYHQAYVAPTGAYAGPGWQGQPGQQGWPQQPPPQPAYVTQPPAAQAPARSGRNNALLAGGAGLVGGLVLAEAYEHHEDRVEEQAYDQGYDQGFDNGQDAGGPDYGGNW